MQFVVVARKKELVKKTKFLKQKAEQIMASNNSHRETDEAARATFKNSLKTKNLLQSPHEEAIMTQIEQNLSSKDNEESLDDSPFFPKKLVSSKDGIMIGTCTGIVQTFPEDLLAYMFLTNTHQARQAHIALTGPDSSKYPNKTIHAINDHHKINYSCRKLPPPLKPRDWLTRHIFHQPIANTITFPEDLLAYMFLTNTHQARQAHIALTGPDSSKYPNKTIHAINDHHKINYSCRKLPPPLKPRDWLTRHIFHQPIANTIKYFATSIHDDDPDLPPSFSKTSLTHIIRGEYSVIHEYERLPHNQTRFKLRLKVDIKGSVPKKIANMGMSGALDRVYKAYKYFQRDKEIDELEVSLK